MNHIQFHDYTPWHSWKFKQTFRSCSQDKRSTYTKSSWSFFLFIRPCVRALGMEVDDEDRSESKRPTSGLAHVYWLREEASLFFFDEPQLVHSYHTNCAVRKEKSWIMWGKEKNMWMMRRKNTSWIKAKTDMPKCVIWYHIFSCAYLIHITSLLIVITIVSDSINAVEPFWGRAKLILIQDCNQSRVEKSHKT